MQTASPVPPEAHWRAALAQGRLLLQRDPESGKSYFPPRLAGSDGQALEWVEASGRGVVYSVTVIHPRPPKEPYNVVLIDLEEGARVMSRVDGVAAQEVAIGMPVIADIDQTPDEPLLVFHPA
jgi:hypothetical protein